MTNGTASSRLYVRSLRDEDRQQPLAGYLAEAGGIGRPDISPGPPSWGGHRAGDLFPSLSGCLLNLRRAGHVIFCLPSSDSEFLPVDGSEVWRRRAARLLGAFRSRRVHTVRDLMNTAPCCG